VTDGLDQALQHVALDLLNADTELTVYDGFVPPGAISAGVPLAPFVVVYTDITRPSESASGAQYLDGRSSHWTAAWYCHCVGGNAEAARAVAQRVRTALLDVAPTVAGVACGLIREVNSTPPTRDETTGVLVMDALRVYELYASA